MAKNSCGHDDCFTCPYPDCIAVIRQEKKEVTADERSLRQKENCRRWREQHPEYTKAYKKKWYQEHREAEILKQRDRVKLYNEQAALDGKPTYGSKYYMEHKEKMKQKAREYYLSHKDEINSKARERRRLKRLHDLKEGDYK